MEKIKKRRGHNGTLIALSLYALLIVVFLVAMSFVLRYLDGWLTDYEAAQPKVKSQQVFEELFAQPDWEKLYAMAGLEDTAYETASHYAAYMAQKTQDGELRYYETSAGLSGDYKYIVRMYDEKLAEFTLTAQEHDAAEIPEWELGTVTLFPAYEENVTVCTEVGRTVCVNGVPLGEDHVIRTAHTIAEDYIPPHLQGHRRIWVYEEGFMVPPQVTAADSQGQPVELIYDAASNMYVEAFEEQVIPQAERDWVLEAATIYCRYMIGDIGHYDMRAYVDDDEPIFNKITKGSKWMQYYTAFRFDEPVFSKYHSYSDSLYSVRLTRSLYLTRVDGTEKEYPLDSTFLVHKREDGSWRVLDIINKDFQELVTQVRLTYIQDGQVLQTVMAESKTMALTPPAVTVPEGKIFTGWYVQQKDEKGNVTYSLAFAPDADGNVRLASELGDEPMTLYALFEKQ